MPLLNYTTSVAASRSIGQIQQLLIKAGARQLMSEYGDDGTTTGLAFVIETPYGLRGFSLPVHADKVHAVLQRQKVERRYKERDHAEKVAWRILKDWVEAQFAIIETEMVTIDQVMLPYMTTETGNTVYELFVKNQMALPGGG